MAASRTRPSIGHQQSGVVSLSSVKRANANADSEARQKVFAASLLAFESHVRSIRDEGELFAHLCNATRRHLQFRQAFFFKKRYAGGAFQATTASSLPSVDRNAPFIRSMENLVGELTKRRDITTQQSFSFSDLNLDSTDPEEQSYPFAEMLWTPLTDGDKVVGGFLTARDSDWIDSDRDLTVRTADLYAHAWRAIKGQNRLTRRRVVTRSRAICAAIAVIVLGCLPVSITALAPVEVAPLDPFVVAAPFDGVVQEIVVDQGASVGSGQTLVLFDDVALKNEVEVAIQREAVADAKFQRASQSAIADASAKREVAVAKAELALAKSERVNAERLMWKTTVKSPEMGKAIFSDKRDWVGRPVSAGETILQIANPNKVRFAINLPVKDSIVLKPGNKIKVFLDSAPTKALEAELTRASYEPTKDKRDILSYSISAELVETPDTLPRIGVQGTARIYSEQAPLAYVVFRRPISALRQFIGW